MRVASLPNVRLPGSLVFRSLTVALALSAVSVVAVAAPAAPVADDKATKDDYSIDTSATAQKIKVNADGTFSLKITPKNGKKVHPEAPLEVGIVDNANVKAAKGKLGRGDLKEKGAKEPEVTTTLRGLKAGATTVEATLSFFLCTDAWCQRMSDRVQIPVTVEE
jgi:hypothetical protein